MRLELDRAARWLDATSVLGGAPLRLFRLTPAGADFVRHGRQVTTGAERALARRLLASGTAHPVADAGPFEAHDVTVVVPVHRDPEGRAATVAAVPDAVVVDDVDGRGPAWARNVGWRRTTTPLVAFLDAACVPEPGWLDALLPLFADPEVVAVAPRVRATIEPGLLARYESARSPLDMGGRPAPVRPGSWVPYVPAAAIVVRRDALEAVGGFDELLRFGEDVDLVWRLGARGSVRYAPDAVVRHPARRSLGRLVQQRFAYGTSAAALAARHGAAVAPIAAPRRLFAVWALVAAGQPAVGGAVLATAVAEAAAGSELPGRVGAGLAWSGHVRLGPRLAEAGRRAWWPLTAVAALCTRRGRWAALAMASPLLGDWLHDRRPVPLPAYVGLRLVDDLAYGAGVWVGCVRARDARALRPRLT